MGQQQPKLGQQTDINRWTICLLFPIVCGWAKKAGGGKQKFK